jgi:tetratricopeptide (TPR) repeat protein
MWITAILILFLQVVAAYAGPVEDCEQAQDIDRRIRGCTDRVRQFPRDATAFFNRGFAHLSKGDLDRAIADYTMVIQIDPAYSPAYYHRGIANESRAQYTEAIADFSRAVEINPRYGRAFAARARVYLKTDQRALALRDAESAVSVDPSDKEFLDTRAHVQEDLVQEAPGRTQKAIADYRLVLPGNPPKRSAISGVRRAAESSATKRPAEPASKAQRSAKPHYYSAQPRHSQEEIECERGGHLGGRFAGYPCWARDAFSARGRFR